MLTAARARYITFSTGAALRFVNFAVDAFESTRNSESSLWEKHFAGTGFASRENEFHELAAEILLSRTVDDFQYYIADIIAWALWRKPCLAELLRAAEMLAAATGATLDDAVKQVARQAAEERSFRGFRAMMEFIESTFDTKIPLEPSSIIRIRKLIAMRNMIAHNHSQKNARYCRDVGEPETNIGQSVRPVWEDAKTAALELDEVVASIDAHLLAELSKS